MVTEKWSGKNGTTYLLQNQKIDSDGKADGMEKLKKYKEKLK